jgi:hypothetical protein
MVRKRKFRVRLETALQYDREHIVEGITTEVGCQVNLSMEPSESVKQELLSQQQRIRELESQLLEAEKKNMEIFEELGEILEDPLTQQVMVTPVLHTEEDRWYEQKVIRKWLTQSPTSPFTRASMSLSNLKKNTLVQKVSDFYYKYNPITLDPNLNRKTHCFVCVVITDLQGGRTPVDISVPVHTVYRNVMVSNGSVGVVAISVYYWATMSIFCSQTVSLRCKII